jgi:fluoride exporter
MVRSLLLVGAGGAAGSMARYAIGLLISKHISHPYPYATFIVNIVGCFIIGILFGITQRNPAFHADWWLVLATGFCGGFTTFSSFALEGNNLLRTQQTGTMLLYTALSLVAGFILCYAGIRLAGK